MLKKEELTEEMAMKSLGCIDTKTQVNAFLKYQGNQNKSDGCRLQINEYSSWFVIWTSEPYFTQLILAKIQS